MPAPRPRAGKYAGHSRSQLEAIAEERDSLRAAYTRLVAALRDTLSCSVPSDDGSTSSEARALLRELGEDA